MMEKLFFEGKDPWQKDENGILRQVKVPKAKQVNMLPYRRKMQIIFRIRQPAWIHV